MAKALKWLIWLLVLLAVTLVVAAGAALVLVEPEDWRDRIERAASRALDRELRLRGPIELSVFPWLGFEVGDVRLGNPRGFPQAPPVLEAKRMELRVQLLPLLRREVRLGTVRLEGVRLHLLRLRDGRSNFEHFGRDADGGIPEGGRRAGGEARVTGRRPAVAAFALGGLVVREAEIAYEDRRAGRSARIAPFTLELGALRPGAAVPVRLEAGFALGPPAALRGRVRLAGTLRPDPGGAHAVDGLRAELRLEPGGGVPPAGLTLTVEGGGRAEPSKDRIVLEPVRLELAGLEARLAEGRIERLSKGPRLVAGLAVPAADLRAALAALGLEPPETADLEALTRVGLEARLWASAQAVELKGLVLTLDGTRLAGEAAVRGLDGRRPKYLADLQADRLDLDRYLPPPREAGRGGGAAAGPAGAASGAALLPVEVLRALRADVRLRVGELKAGGLRSRDVRLALEAEGGRIRLHPATARLYGGRYRGDVRIDARGREPVVRLDERLEGVRLGPLLRDLAGLDRLTGTGTVRARLSARGSDPMALRRTLAGEVALALRDGAVRGVNLAALAREAQALLRGEPVPAAAGPDETDFTEITATARIRAGLLRNEDLLGKSPFLRVTGKGTVDLVRERLDYRLTAMVVSTAKGQGGEGLEDLEGVPIPLRLEGPLAAPKVRLDAKALLTERQKRRLEKKKKKLEEKLRRRLEKELGEELGRGLEERLKGLFR